MRRTPALRLRSRAVAVALAVGSAALLGGCGSDELASAMAEPPAGQTLAPLVCAKDATAVAVPAAFPAQAAVPQGYVVTDVQARTAGRTVVTAVSPKPFEQTLADMQSAYSTRGWTPSEGEVEDRDAESNFAGNGLRGRWAIREIPDCTGNTSVSVLVGK